MSTTRLGLANVYGKLDNLPAADVILLANTLEWVYGGMATVDVTGSADVTLGAADYDSHTLILIGALGASINLVVPTLGEWVVINGSTGGTFTVTVKPSGGTGVALQQGETARVLGDGTNVRRAGASAGINSDITRLRSLEGGTATAVAGTATLNSQSGTVTSQALTTAAGADESFTLTNSLISASSRVFVSLANGSNTIAPIYVSLVTPGSGSVVIKVRNGHASSALNGTIKLSVLVIS